MRPHGSLAVFLHGEAEPEQLTVTRNSDHTVVFAQDFSSPVKPELKAFAGGYYLELPEGGDTCYTVEMTAKCLKKGASFSIASGITGGAFDGEGQFDRAAVNMHEYCVGAEQYGTGLKVYKDGREGYRMGDYSSSVYAGNLRRYYTEELEAGTSYCARVDFGGETGDRISGAYTKSGSGEKIASFDAKLEFYNRDIYHSVTEDETQVYIKLVNPATASKRCRIHYEDLALSDGRWISLSADDEAHIHAQNINTRDSEPVAPRECPVEVQTAADGTGFSEIILAEQSVNVLVFRKNS
jgi:hypothetical protein